MTPPPAEYVPDRGDLVWFDFDPQAGREQGGRRPAIVLSRSSYNGPSGLALVCPITSRVKGYPFEMQLPSGLPVSGVVLVDHVKSADWRVRRAERVGAAPLEFVAAVLKRLNVLFAP